MKFLIRDDDPCAFTDPEELNRCYHHIWGKIPINFSVTPFRVPGPDKSVPKKYYNRSKPMPLEENTELISFFKEKLHAKQLDIALHGFNHTSPKGLPEYVGGEDLPKKTHIGKLYLEDLLNVNINTFVPPNNRIAKAGLHAVTANNLNLVNIPSLIKFNQREFSITNFYKFVFVQFYRKVKNMKYPFVLDFHDHKEIDFYPITPSQPINCLMHGFNQCKKLNGIFVFSVHYHAFDRRLKSGEKIKDVLDLFIEMASKSNNIEWCTYNDIWKWSHKKRNPSANGAIG